MQVIIFGTIDEEIQSLVKQAGFTIMRENSGAHPDFVISYGGDGTLMRAEARYPGIPKIILRHSAICKKCSPLPNQTVLEKVARGDYMIEEMMKLGAEAEGGKLEGINDIIVHNKDPRHAIRYRIIVNGKEIPREIIGDGIVAATPFGSTAYYRSITDNFFEVGIGLAFNNSTEQSDHMVLDENSVIDLEVTRGPAIAYADNQETMIELEAGSSIRIQKTERRTNIVVPK